MPTPHLAAQPGTLSDIVLLPGDPMRARRIAERFFTESQCHNEVRGMYGYTGLFRGRKVSVQGSGMGVPSIGIYAHELITHYNAKTLIRVGTCGALQPEIALRDVLLAQGASTDSSFVSKRFPQATYAPLADFDLLHAAYKRALAKGQAVRVGNIFTSDTFYEEDPDGWKHWAKYGLLAVEMESAALYTLAARYRVRALSVLTVSDNLVHHTKISSEDREKGFEAMVELALEAALEVSPEPPSVTSA